MLTKKSHLPLLTTIGIGIAAIVSPSSVRAQVACDLNGVAQPPLPGASTGSLLCGDWNIFGGSATNVVAVGTDMYIEGPDGTLLGNNTAVDSDFIIVDPFAFPLFGGRTAIGSHAISVGGWTVAVGDGAVAGLREPAFGGFLIESVFFSTAIGSRAEVSAGSGTALGAFSRVTDAAGMALGASALSMGEGASAIGTSARTNGLGALAIGAQANAQITAGASSIVTVPTADAAAPMAAGYSAQAFGGDSLAVGNYALIGNYGDTSTSYNGATAVGTATHVTADNATTLGARTEASAENSVALGYGSVADQANTVSVGAAGSERKIVNVAAGTAPTDAVNVSQLQSVTGDVSAVQTTVTTHTTQITDLQTGLADTNDDLASETSARIAADNALDTRVDALETITANLDERFDDVEDRSDAGTAAAVALSGAMFLPGKTFNLTGNVGAYRGAVAGAVQIGALVSDMVAINAGIAHGFNKGGKTAVRAGFTLGW